MCLQGETNIFCFEVTDEPPFVHPLIKYSSSFVAKGMGWMPKRGCDVNKCEIARYKIILKLYELINDYQFF